MTAPTVADVLRRAADEIDARGWCQGTFSDEYGRVCVEGAINCAVFGSPRIPGGRDEEFEIVLCASEAIESVVHRSATGWNDQDGRTAAEVKAALLAAAGKADQS